MMETLCITIKEPGAKNLLRDMAEMDLIGIEPTQQEEPPMQPRLRKAGWGKDIIAKVLPSFDAPLEEFREYE